MDLKPYYDAALAAEGEIKRIANAINDHFTAGENDQALELRPELDAAKAKAQTANELYASMRNATTESDLPKLFVPANPDVQTPADKIKVMDRLTFDALSPHERMRFIKSGGQIIDQ
jgi:hypothetical protein